MADKITRRDFLNGTQVAIGASLLTPWTEVFGSGASKFDLGPDYYPPAKTGLRGSHVGSWETMHARVAGTTDARFVTSARYASFAARICSIVASFSATPSGKYAAAP